MRLIRRAAKALLVLAAASWAPAAAGQSYTVVDLGTLGGNASGSDGIDDLGRVVGWSKDASGAYYGYISTPAGPPLTSLGPFPGGSYTYALAVNEAGQVVGYGRLQLLGPEHAFLWQNGTMTDLGTLGGTNSVARAINASGVVVGRSQSGPSAYHAFVWSNGTMTALPGLPGGYPDSDATGINDAGVIVGQAWDASSRRQAVVWESGVLSKVLDLPAGATGAKASAINSTNQVAGNSWIAGGATRAVLWSAAGAATELPRVRSRTYNVANGINDAGQVVGDTYSGGHLVGGSAGPVLWEHGIAFELEDITAPAPGIALAYASAINTSGQIVGTGSAAGGFRALRLDPVANGLGLTGPDPGYVNQLNRAAVRGGTAGQSMYFAYGLAVGTTAVPGCPGVTLPVAGAQLLGSSPVDGNGHAVYAQVVPPAASGRTIYLVAVEYPSCRVANRTARYFF